MHRQHPPRRLILAASAVLAVAGLSISPAAAQCTYPAWADGYAFAGVQGDIRDAVVFRGELYIGGSISLAGSTSVTGLAKWNGSRWLAVGGVYANPNASGGIGTSSRTPGSVSALGVVNDVLYIGGSFQHLKWLDNGVIKSTRASNVASFDGTSFSPLGQVVNVPTNDTTTLGPGVLQNLGAQFSVATITGGPDGKVYIGGDFDTYRTTATQPLPSLNIVVYEPSTRTLSDFCAGGANVGQSTQWGYMPTTIKNLAFFDDGSGPALYAGGIFSSIGFSSTGGLAKFQPLDGGGCGVWQPVGGVSTDLNVNKMKVLDVDGPGPVPAQLYLTGVLARADGSEYMGVGKWDGTSRIALSEDGFPDSVAVYDDGSGPALFSSVSILGNLLRKWDSATNTWIDVPGTFRHGAKADNQTHVTSSVLIPYTPPGQPAELYLMGNFTNVGAVIANSAARWNGARWAGVPDGKGPATLFFSSSSNAITGGIRTMQTLDADGPGAGGPAIYATGSFESIGGVMANHIAKFDGHAWTPMGDGVGDLPGRTDYPIQLLTRTSQGSTTLYAVSHFAGSEIQANTLRQWTGTTWQTIPGGPDGPVYSAAELNGEIYVAGGFTSLNMNAIQASNIAKWNPTTGWAAVSGDVFSATLSSLVVHAGQLYAGGGFTTISGSPANGIARWTGTGWAPLIDASTLSNGVAGSVGLLLSHGGDLYIGGRFMSAPGVVRWNTGTSTFTSIGVVSGGFNPGVHSIAAGTNADGSAALFIGGAFTTVGPANTVANGIAKYTPSTSTWSALTTPGFNGVSIYGTLPALSPRVAGTVGQVAVLGSQVVISGSESAAFTDAGGTGATNLAIWGCPPVVCVADFDQNGTPSIDDIFIFLNAWFAQNPRCDVDQNSIISIDDIFIFLNRWFAGC